MAKSKADIMKLDLYGILGVNPEATEKEIVRAYRKKALKCHPDKNPDNPKAAELFHELSNALEVLTDPSAKAAYDNVLRAKKLAERRNKELDSKRKKLKDDLEARERFADQQRTDSTKAQRNLLAEIERLRKEGSRLLEQEQKLMREKMQNDLNLDDDDSSDSNKVETPKIKIRWNAKRADTCGAYTEEDLQALFSRYGEITNILVSSKKKGSAIIEFESYTPTLKLAENEHGTVTNPLTVTWLSGKPLAPKPAERCPSPPAPVPTYTAVSKPSVNSGFDCSSTTSNVGHRDFESLVLMKMRQAEERKRLIEQMQREDEEEGNK